MRRLLEPVGPKLTHIADYYDFTSKGRGEVLRLFFEDAGIKFEDVRMTFQEVNGKTLAERAAVKCVDNPLCSNTCASSLALRFQTRPSSLASASQLIFAASRSLCSEIESPFLARSPVGSVPYVELAGKTLTQSYPMLRLFARQLGAYDGKDDESKYFVDVINDLSLDWRTLFVTTAFVNNAKGLSGNPDSVPFVQHKEFNLPSSSFFLSPFRIRD